MPLLPIVQRGLKVARMSDYRVGTQNQTRSPVIFVGVIIGLSILLVVLLVFYHSDFLDYIG